MTRSRRSRDAGFSLVEMMAVVAILSILVLVAIGTYVGSIGQSRRIACLHNLRALDNAMMPYRLEHDGAIIPDLAALRGYVRWSGAGYATCVLDGTPFGYDAVTGTVTCPNHPR